MKLERLNPRVFRVLAKCTVLKWRSVPPELEQGPAKMMATPARSLYDRSGEMNFDRACP